MLERADGEESAGRLESACAMLERALPRYAGAERAAAWFRLGIVRTRLGRYREAAAAYAAVVADGAADAAVYANFAEVLMAAGRLPDAQARYRDAISAATDLGVGDRRERVHELALAYYGLAVALDRDEQPLAAREAMLRALENDPTTAVLKIASTPGGDFFFVPDGDVFYYLGLAAEAEGRDGDAEAAFREFIARAPRSRWAHAAEAHLGKKPAARRGGAGAAGAAPRIIAYGTVLATGGLAAPLVDAAWRDQLPILDECLGELRMRAARDGAHRDRDGGRRPRKTDARHREGAGCRTTSGLRVAWNRPRRRGCAFRCPGRRGPRWRAPRWSSACPRRSPLRPDPAVARDEAGGVYGEVVVRSAEAALHRRRRADRCRQEQPRRDPGRRSCRRG